MTNDENQPAKVFDAGVILIIFGYSRSRVEEALDKLAKAGSRTISPVTQVSDKWIASCEHPKAPVSACKDALIGGKQIVMGPTREAVSMKVEELIHFGSVLVDEIALVHGVWACRLSGRRSAASMVARELAWLGFGLAKAEMQTGLSRCSATAGRLFRRTGPT